MPRPYKPDLSDLPDVDPRPLSFDEKCQWEQKQYATDYPSNRKFNGGTQTEPPKEPDGTEEAVTESI